MRRGIETAPRDGKLVVLEDDATGAYEFARWSDEARAWVGENGELSKIAPTHWHATRRGEHLLQEGDEYLLQSEGGSSGPSESRERPSFPSSSDRVEPQSPFVAPDVIAPPRDGRPRPDEYLQQQLDEIFRLRDESSGPSESRERPRFFSSSDRVEPQSPFVAPDVIAPRRAAIPSPMNVVAIKSQIAPGKAQAGRGFAVSSIAAAMIAASLIGMFFYFRAEVTAYVTQSADRRDGPVELVKQATESPIQDSQKADLVAPTSAVRQLAEADAGSKQSAAWPAAQVPETKAPEAIEPLRFIDGRDVELRAAAAAQSQERDGKKSAASQPGLTAARQELMANRALAEERDRSAALASELATARREVETQVALSSKTGEEAAQLKRAAETATAELQQSLKQQRERAEALASELATARRDVETQITQSRMAREETAQLKRAAEAATGLQQSVQQERERAEALAGELAKAQREVEAQVALSSKKDDEAAQLKRAAETATAELQQSLRQQRDKTLALESQLAMARRDVATEVATSRKTDDEAAQLNQATKNAQAELRQSPQQERDKPGAPARGPKSTGGPVGARLPLAANNQTAKVKQTAVATAAEPLVAAEAKGSAEAARLLERASALLGQGNIGAARIVLERAVETGSAQATFALAETYDPLVLSTWRTYGTQGDATKARELYAKAYDGGVKAAKDRSDALQPASSEAK